MVRLYVGGLTEDISSEQIAERFRPFGSISSCQVIPIKLQDGSDPDPTKCRGFAYVEFAPKDENALKRCISMYNGCKWRGCTLRVETARVDYRERLETEWAAEKEAEEQALLEEKEKEEEDEREPMDVLWGRLVPSADLLDASMRKYDGILERYRHEENGEDDSDDEEVALNESQDERGGRVADREEASHPVLTLPLSSYHNPWGGLFGGSEEAQHQAAQPPSSRATRAQPTTDAAAHAARSPSFDYERDGHLTRRPREASPSTDDEEKEAPIDARDRDATIAAALARVVKPADKTKKTAKPPPPRRPPPPTAAVAAPLLPPLPAKPVMRIRTVEFLDAGEKMAIEAKGRGTNAASLAKFDSDEEGDGPSRSKKARVLPLKPQQEAADMKKSVAMFLRAVGKGGSEQDTMKFEFKPWRPPVKGETTTTTGGGGSSQPDAAASAAPMDQASMYKARAAERRGFSLKKNYAQAQRPMRDNKTWR